jgi:membrane protease YdiL (CAAX protease family)
MQAGEIIASTFPLAGESMKKKSGNAGDTIPGNSAQQISSSPEAKSSSPSASDPMSRPTSRPKLIASRGHLVGYLAILVGLVLWGYHTQQAGIGKPGTIEPGQLGSHSAAIPFYLISIFGDLALAYYCWAGVHKRGGNLETLTGGRWRSWKQVAQDVAITIPFWIIWELAAWGFSTLVGPREAKSVDALLPQSALEVVLWILVSINAGITEEIQSRGYLQQQLHSLTGSVTVAVLLQGLAFGFMHAYQGWQAVVVIAGLGVLYGALAAWRRNLRANMMAHAATDIWEGWLKFLVWK